MAWYDAINPLSTTEDTERAEQRRLHPYEPPPPDATPASKSLPPEALDPRMYREGQVAQPAPTQATEAPTTTVQPPAPVAAPAPAPAHAPGSAQANIAKKLSADYEQRIGAMKEEGAARQAGSEAETSALGNQAETARVAGQTAEVKAGEARTAQDSARDEIHQLTQDYANGHIDPDKWWHDKTTPGKIATVLGGMLSGVAGGPKGAMEYYDTLINRSIASQQEELHRKGAAGIQVQNLLTSLMQSSKNEEEAIGKARALQYNAAMVEVQKAAAAARGPVEQAQIKELIADMATARDMALAGPQGKGGAVGLGNGWIPTTEEQRGAIYKDPNTGEEFLMANKTVADKLVEDTKTYNNILNLLEQARQNLKERRAMADDSLLGNIGERAQSLNPYSQEYANITNAQSIAGELKGAHAKLFSSRGVTPGIERVSQEIVGEIGSRSGVWNPQKIDTYKKYLKAALDESKVSGGAVPIDSQLAPGGKQGILTAYVRGRAPQLQAPVSAPTAPADVRPAIPSYAKPR